MRALSADDCSSRGIIDQTNISDDGQLATAVQLLLQSDRLAAYRKSDNMFPCGVVYEAAQLRVERTMRRLGSEAGRMDASQLDTAMNCGWSGYGSHVEYSCSLRVHKNCHQHLTNKNIFSENFCKNFEPRLVPIWLNLGYAKTLFILFQIF